MSFCSVVSPDLYRIKWCEPGASVVSICVMSIGAVLGSRKREQMVRSSAGASGIGPIDTGSSFLATAMSGEPLPPPSPPLLLLFVLPQPRAKSAKTSVRRMSTSELALDAQQLVHGLLVGVRGRV